MKKKEQPDKAQKPKRIALKTERILGLSQSSVGPQTTSVSELTASDCNDCG